MRFIVKDQPDWIGQWVADQVGFEYIPGRMTAIGLVEGTEVIGGVVFQDYTETNIWMHVASAEGCKWRGARNFLYEVFTYAFKQLGCTWVSGWVPMGNEKALNLDLRLGFKLLYLLEDGDTDGDVGLVRMHRDDCRWIKGE